MPWGTIGNVTGSINAAATWRAASFIAPVTSTLNSVRAYVSAKSGTLVAADSTIDVFSSTFASSQHTPNASVHGPISCNSAISAAGWYTWSPSYAVTQNTRYWIVFKNANATPASNNYTLRDNTTLLTSTYGTTLQGQLGVRGTTNSGSTWAGISAVSALRLGFSDGSYFGLPISNTLQNADYVYSSREAGTKFTLPTNLNCKVIGAGIVVEAKTGTPTGTARIRLYTGSSPSLQATGEIGTNTQTGLAIAYFSSAVSLTGGTICRVVLSETTQSDASTNRYNTTANVIDTDASSAQLFPYSAQSTYYNGTSWSDDATRIIPYCLILNDETDEFEAGGSSGGVLIPRTFTGF